MSQLKNVSVDLKANVYFDGKVVSHSVYEADGSKKTLGLIYPGQYYFGTGKPELMIITAGLCSVRLKGNDQWKSYKAGEEFRIQGNSGFDIKVESGIAEYLCVFEES